MEGAIEDKIIIRINGKGYYISIPTEPILSELVEVINLMNDLLYLLNKKYKRIMGEEINLLPKESPDAPH